MAPYLISTDPKLLDIDFVVNALQSTYWAGGRAREVIVASLSTSFCFGVYEAETRSQVGFARVVSDTATFSWICDVFIDPAHRARGLGKRLMTEIVGDPRFRGTNIFLGTKDAHGLYERYGFQRWELMRRAADKKT